jgi:Transposase DDE domain
VRVRRLGRNRAGEIRLFRFLHNPAVSVAEMVATAAARTRTGVVGRHVLAIQDTTSVRAGADGRCMTLHPVIAVDAIDGTLLGLVGARFFLREGGKRGQRRKRDFTEKESRRWLDGAECSADLVASGAALVTVVADREGDIYEDFACKPRGVEMLIRAGQDRSLADGSHLFAKAEMEPEAGRMTVDLPAAPGRSARSAVLSLCFCAVEIARPKSRTCAGAVVLPESVPLTLVEAREINPPQGVAGPHWRLLTTHSVADAADARRIVGLYRQRWTIEQLFRTLKTQGFDVEASRLAAGGPFEKLVAASLIAAVTVLQLVRERDGVAKRPLEDAFDPDDREALEAVSANLEGNTARQKNPHPKGSLAFAAWTFARLGGWTGYYGKPGPIVMLHGLVRFHAIKHGWTLQNV